MNNHGSKTPREKLPKNKARNMHDGVTAAEDEVCCCEPEPRWQAIADAERNESTEHHREHENE